MLVVSAAAVTNGQRGSCNKTAQKPTISVKVNKPQEVTAINCKTRA
jgi:hypothetical protein